MIELNRHSVRRFRTGTLWFIGTLAGFLTVSCRNLTQKTEDSLIDVISHYEETVVPLHRQIQSVRWKFSETEVDSYCRVRDSFYRLQIEFLHDPPTFSKLSDIRQNRSLIKDPYLLRQLDILYDEYLLYQADTALLRHIVDLDAYLRRQVWYRLSCEETRGAEQTLRHSQRDSDLYRAWHHIKASGLSVRDSLLLLVDLRNELARSLGYPDYFSLKLDLDDLDMDYVDGMMDKLYKESRAAYHEVASAVKEELCRKYGLKENQIRPWHMRGYFLEYGWRACGPNRDPYYSYVSMVDVASRFFAGIGLDLEDVLGRSDLSGSKKYPVYTCLNMDREGDIRLLCNLSDTENDLHKLLGQVGIAVYLKNIPNALPYLLKAPPAPLVKEGVYSFFSRMSGYSNWVLSMGILSVSQAGDLRGTYQQRLHEEQLFWVSWSMMMYEFEKALYRDPAQNLDSLWKELMWKYLEVDLGEDRQGKSDWAAEPYFVILPCSFHNSVLGELWASQMVHYFCLSDVRNGSEMNPDFVGNEAIGEHLKKKVFGIGASKDWREVTYTATGDSLSTIYFIRQFGK